MKKLISSWTPTVQSHLNRHKRRLRLPSDSATIVALVCAAPSAPPGPSTPLRAALRRSGLTQAALAARLGISRSTTRRKGAWRRRTRRSRRGSPSRAEFPQSPNIPHKTTHCGEDTRKARSADLRIAAES